MNEAERNLLFGLLALQNSFIDRRALVAAFDRWVHEKAVSLGGHLIAMGDLDAARHDLLDALVVEHLKQHDNDAQRSLAAISTFATVEPDLRQLADADIQASVAATATLRLNAPRDDIYATTVSKAPPSVSRFRILRPHARGGLGEVYVARDEELHREVALKEIQSRYADDQGSRARFVLEAEITGGLEHPGIVPVYGLGSYADGRPFYAMRFIRGDSLKEAIDRYHSPQGKQQPSGQRSLELRGLLARFIDVCNAIEYAHSRGVLHRDLKPGNIMLGKYGETLVVDWGLSKPAAAPDAPRESAESLLRPSSLSGSAPTQVGSAVGTPQFMSPEQAAGKLDELGPASDVYSLGATLYCLLAGGPPIKAAKIPEILHRVMRGEIDRPRERNPDVPRALEAICLKAMALRPPDRYRSARALADDVEHWLADEPVSALPESPSQKLARWARRHRRSVQSAAAALLLVSVVSAAASFLIHRAWRREADAHRVAERQSALAEESFQQARKTVDKFFTQVSETELLDVPGLQPLRRELLESARKYYKDFLRQRDGDPALRQELAETHYRLGRILSDVDTKRNALREFEQARAIEQALLAENPTDDVRFAAANSENALGDVYLKTGDLKPALASFQRALALREKLAHDQPDRAEYTRKLANSHNNVAIVLAKLAHPTSAWNEYTVANRLRQTLAEQYPDQLPYLCDLARGYYNLAALKREAGEWADAAAWFEMAEARYRELAQADPRGISYSRELAVTLRSLGDADLELGRAAKAADEWDEARRVAERLARQNPLLIELQADVAAAYLTIGRQPANGAPESALEWFQRAQTLLERLVADDPETARYQQDLAACHVETGRAQQSVGNNAAARARFDAADDIFAAMLAKNPSDFAAQKGRAQILACRAALARDEGDLNEARRLYGEALQQYEQQQRDDARRERDAAIASLLLDLAAVQRQRSDLPAAAETLEKCAGITAFLLEQYPEWQSYRLLQARSVYLTAVIEFERGLMDASLASFQTAAGLCETLPREQPIAAECTRLCGTVYDEMAVVLWQSQRYDEALAASRRASGMLRPVWQAAPHGNAARQTLSSHLANRARLESADGNWIDAAELVVERQSLWPQDARQLYLAAADLALIAADIGDGAGNLTDEQAALRTSVVEKSIAVLRDALTAGFTAWGELAENAAFKILADNPRFQELLKARPPGK